MAADSGVRLEVLKVDGGVTLNELCMQIQADVLGVDVVRPRCPRRPTGCGLCRQVGCRLLVRPRGPAGQLARKPPLEAAVDRRAAHQGYAGWRKAVERTLDWVDVAGATCKQGP